LKAGTDNSLRDAVQQGLKRSVALKNGFITRFANDVDKLFGKKLKSIATPKDILDGMDSMLPKGVRATENGLDFSTTQLAANPGEISQINRLYNTLDSWNDFSAKGLIELKQLVGKFAKFPIEGGGTSKSPTIGRYYKYIDELIRTRLPISERSKYNELNKVFSEQINTYDEMIDAFGSGEPFTRMANLFSKNKDRLRQLVNFYEKKSGQKIAPIVATREMAEGGATSWLNIKAFVDSIVPPKLRTQVTAGAGKISKIIPKPIKETARQSLISTAPKPLIKMTSEGVYNAFKNKQ
jgi:hypothetical protein